MISTIYLSLYTVQICARLKQVNLYSWYLFLEKKEKKKIKKVLFLFFYIQASLLQALYRASVPFQVFFLSPETPTICSFRKKGDSRQKKFMLPSNNTTLFPRRPTNAVPWRIHYRDFQQSKILSL